MRLLALILALSVSAFAQKNEVAVSVVGNFNPVSYAYIQQSWPVIISSNRSSLGGGATYQRWLSEHLALGLSYEQNPSDGKLLGGQHYYIWPEMRYEIAAIASQQIAAKRVSLFVREGAGSIITNGYSNSGISHDLAILEGFGADYRLNSRFTVRIGMAILQSKTGCYNDPTCKPTWSAVQDVYVGPLWRW